MFLFVLIMIYWFVAALFGNDFIQFSIGGINTFYVLMGISIIYFLLRTKKGRRANFQSVNGYGFYKAAAVYMIISAIYLMLSMLNFTSIFNIDVNYSSYYVVRQGYLIFTFPISFVIINCTVKYWDTVKKYFFSRKFLVSVWTILAIACIAGVEDIVVMRPLVFALASMLLILNSRSMISWILFVYTVFRMIEILESSSSFIGIIVALMIFFFTDTFTRLLKRNTGWKIWLLISMGIVFLALFADEFVSLISSDANTMWRWQYWMNELAVVRKTFGVGVGYGTAYASNSIYDEINNPQVFLNTVNSEKGGIFVVTQHNSFVNALYRTGVAGFVAIINLVIVKSLRWFSSVYTGNRSEKDIFLKWGIMNYGYNLMIILMNPGLESPRFAIGFLLTFAFLIAGIILQEDTHETFCDRQTESLP